MKPIFLLTLVAMLFNTSLSFSQSTKLTLKDNSASIEEIIKIIETQSDYTIFYKDNQLDTKRIVNFDMKNATVAELLNSAFLNTDITYKLLDKLIVITSKVQFQRKIIGNVSSSNENQALSGVNVLVKGTKNGTITDLEGNYSLDVEENAILVFSFLGYHTLEMKVNNQTVINLVMEEDTKGIDEVVVIGYGITARKNVASSMSVLKANELVGLSSTDVRQAIQGKMAGVQVINNSGDPGAGAKMIIRGMGSFSNPDPLFVVDGIQGGDINSIPAQDIESITVLKDASTTAIYGSSAANGVVLINTKNGKKGAIKVSYDGSFGLAKFNKRYQMLNAINYVDLISEIQAASGLPVTDKLKSDHVLVDRTDWQEEIFRNAFVTEQNFRFSSGGDIVTYSFSSAYQNQESTVLDRNFKRITLGAKLGEQLFKKKLRFAQNFRLKMDKNEGIIADFNDALRMPPYIPVYDSNNLGGFGTTNKLEDLNDANNPLNAVYNTDYIRKALNLEFEFSGELDLFEGLFFKTQSRFYVGNENDNTWKYPSNSGNFNKPSSDMSENFSTYSGMIAENFFSYNKLFGNHSLIANFGNTYSPAGEYRSINAIGSNYSSDAIHNIAFGKTSSIGGAIVNSGKARLSYFGRAGYTYKEKYVFNASIRRDASSVFGENNRWGIFYGIGLAWDASMEDFMSSVDAILTLKLRTSYGKTGNDNIPTFLTSSTVWKGDASNIVYSFGDNLTYAYGATINSIANPDLKWEETFQFDIGVDLGLLNNKINFVFDYYQRSNNDLLIETQLPISTGLGRPGTYATQWVNAASMSNSGLETALTYNSSNESFKWDLSLNSTFSTNKVTSLGTVGNLPISKGEFQTGIGNSTRTDIGHPLASFYGYKFDHIVVDQTEISRLNASAVQSSGGKVSEYKVGLKPGDRVWKDTDLNGYIDDKDRTYIGNPSPKWQFGAVFNASYKNFDFQLTLQGIAGVDVVNGGRYWWEGMSKPFNNTTTVLRRWRKEGDVTDIPAAGQNSGLNLAFSDWYVEKGDYLRVKNVILGYTLPKHVFKNNFNLRVYVAFQNIITLTKYSGYDPEISSYSPNDNNNLIFQRGVDLYQRPNPILFRFGLQLNI